MPSASHIRGRLAHGGILLVPVHFLGQDVECLVDTGAAYTALSAELVALLGLSVDSQRTVTVATAYGTLRTVPRITLVWSKNSCDLSLVVFEQCAKPFTTLHRAVISSS